MLKCLKRQVPLNPPKMAKLDYPPRRSTGRDSPTGPTAKAADTLAGSGRRGCDDGAASAASAINRLNAGSPCGSVLAPFNEIVGGVRP